jgi:hypothetical protein
VHRRNEFDVTNRVDTTKPEEVAVAVCRIHQDLYEQESSPILKQAFDDLARLYRGEMPGYHACDTGYHDIQHVLDVTLAMARLMDGCVRTTSVQTIPERLFRFGVISALYHDCGYIRHRKDTRHEHGAEYTKTHVSRGVRFLEDYMPTIGMGDLAQAAARTLHFTGYEIPPDRIRVPGPEFRLIGNLLGSADILAQMADRCYLEKCYDRLYPEFVLGGIARQRTEDGSEQIMFASAADLIYKTPRFYEGTTKRLENDFAGQYRYIEAHFGGQNLYFDELDKNIRHARAIAAREDISMLRRKPPGPEAEEAAEAERQPRLI